MDPNALFKLTYGLFVLSTFEDGKHNACIINTVTQVADKGIITISVNKLNKTCDMLKKSKCFTVSVISEEADFSLFEHFGFQSGNDVDKFSSFAECKAAPNGTMIVTKGTNAFISADIIDRRDLGTHVLFTAKISDAEILSDAPSASYAYYHANIKPKPIRAEPEEGKAKKVAWRCKICGFVFEGDELPADYVCPLCKHPASDFERIEI